MHLRDQHVHRDVIDQLPILAEKARVTDVTALDRDRTEEVKAAIAELLETQDHRPGGESTDVETLVSFLETEIEDTSVASRLRALLERYERSYPSLLRIRIRADSEIMFVPGQYIALNYAGIPRAYSLTSQPDESELEICVRRVPTGRLTPRLATELAEGARITVRGPFGELSLNPRSDRDLVFLATGTGVAPFKSMIDYTFREGWDEHDGEPRDVWLFLGAAWEDEIPYYEEFRALDARHANFHFVPTLSRESILTDWEGETAYVQEALLKYVDGSALTDAAIRPGDGPARRAPPRNDVGARLRPDEMEVYACGINAMVYGLMETVREVGVPEEHVQLEGYG